MTTLIGRQVCVQASEWLEIELATVIRDADLASERSLLELDTPAEIGGRLYVFAVARPRLKNQGLSTLIESGRLSCNVTLVPSDRFDATLPFDVSWWRGGAAAITDIRLR